MDQDFGAVVGIDWAVDKHDVCALRPDGELLAERVVEHTPAGLNELAEWLLSLGAGEAAQVLVGIEVPHGPVVELLVERGFRVHAINPKQLDRFRDRFSLAGAKDDRLDARVLADSLRTDRHCFRELQPEEPLVVELREWSRLRDDLRDEQVGLGNRIRQQLRRYYPQLLKLGSDVVADWFMDLWKAARTPAKARRLRHSTIERILKSHRIRRVSASEVRAVLRGPGFVVAAGTTEAAAAHVDLLIDRVRVVNTQLRRCDRRLDELTAELAKLPVEEEDEPGQSTEQHDVEILRSLPGVGRIVLAVLLGEAWRLVRDRDYHGLRTYSGVAPVTKRSGRSVVVIMRSACNPRLRDALYHWSRVAAQADPFWKARYSVLRSRGQPHGRALRTIGDRLLGTACAMLRNRTTYDAKRDRQAA